MQFSKNFIVALLLVTRAQLADQIVLAKSSEFGLNTWCFEFVKIFPFMS
jgi:hypothetical protein